MNEASEMTNVTLDTGEAMPAYCARPPAAPRGAVLIIVDMFGLRAFYEDLARRVAAAGYVCLAPDYFFRQGRLAQITLPAAFARREHLDENRTLVDLSRTLDWLRRDAQATGRIGSIGFCMGGTLALDLAARRGDLATVCYYAFPADDGSASQLRAPAPLALVDRISGPILGFWGDQDQNVGLPNVHRLVGELTARRISVDHVIYPAVAHGFLADANFRPDHPAYPAASDSWRRALSFLGQHLVGAA